jgi:hypothetical protein
MFVMLVTTLKRRKSRLKIVTIIIKKQGYPLLKYLLAFCLHKINIFEPYC